MDYLTNLKSLPAELQETIQNRPTNTIVLANKSKPQFNLYQKPREDLLSKNFLLDNFDGRVVWKSYINPVKDQGTCGSCWAFATSSVLAHRFNILSLGQYTLDLSPTKMILCDWGGAEVDLIEEADDVKNAIDKVTQANISNIKSSACFGNTLEDSGRFLYLMGTNTEDCVPYTKRLGNEREFQTIGSYTKMYELPLCIGATGQSGDMCSNYTYDQITGNEDGIPARFYKCYHYYGLYGTTDYNPRGNEFQIRLEMYKWGPVATGFQVYSDFYTYNARTDIYVWNGKSIQVGGHAVEIVGWGIRSSDKMKYWIVRNSWGPNWGDGGYFKIRRGTNECGIEQSVMGMVPDFFYNPGSNPYIPPLNLKIYNKKGYKSNVEDRKQLQQKTSVGGGVDPTTGYTRRTMIRYPWLDTTRPVSLDMLPRDWVDFFAGNTQNKAVTNFNKNLQKTCQNSSMVSDSENNSKKNMWIWVWIILGIICLAIIVTLIILL